MRPPRSAVAGCASSRTAATPSCPSASLVSDDPTLLFTVAGMVPFIPYLLGAADPAVAARDQRAEVRAHPRHRGGRQDHPARHVLPDERQLLLRRLLQGRRDHLRLGAGDRLAGATAATASTRTRSGSPSSRPTTRRSALWKRIAGLPDERIQRRGMEGQLLVHGSARARPGPCSEIYVDRGPGVRAEGGPVADEDRYLEIWNLVFMQYERGAGGGKDDFPILGDAAAARTSTPAWAWSGSPTCCRAWTTCTRSTRSTRSSSAPPTCPASATAASPVTGPTRAEPGDDVRLRVVADHVRSALMLIGDGVTPSNEGRGYVLRRLMRRAVRAMRLLGVDGPGAARAAARSAATRWPRRTPSSRRDFARISQVAYAEEEAFRRTLRGRHDDPRHGGPDREERWYARRSRGDQAFQLHDTYGFPIDLTLEMAAEQGVGVDEAGSAGSWPSSATGPRPTRGPRRPVPAGRRRLPTASPTSTAAPVEFTGYDEVDRRGARGRAAGRRRPSAGRGRAGDEVELVLDRTPFYAEGGGQLADTGTIELADGAVRRGRRRPAAVHGPDRAPRPRAVAARSTVGDQVQALVDIDRRQAISRAHTATHLVHKAMREALGDTATQAGSQNAPGRFRFDFRPRRRCRRACWRDVEARGQRGAGRRPRGARRGR